MALDGLVISALCSELNQKLAGTRIDKIHQPEKDELLISVRGYGVAYKLLVCANPSFPRLHLSNIQKENRIFNISELKNYHQKRLFFYI